MTRSCDDDDVTQSNRTLVCSMVATTETEGNFETLSLAIIIINVKGEEFGIFSIFSSVYLLS